MTSLEQDLILFNTPSAFLSPYAKSLLFEGARYHASNPHTNHVPALQLLRTAATLTESGFGDMALSLAGQIDESESVIVAAILSMNGTIAL